MKVEIIGKSAKATSIKILLGISLQFLMIKSNSSNPSFNQIDTKILLKFPPFSIKVLNNPA